MFLRIIVAACVLSLAGCQQAGRELDATSGVTAPSSLSMKAVDVPFAGSVTGEAVFDFAANPKGCAAGFTTITTAFGNASHMGRTTWVSQHCLGPDDTLVDSELVLTAANGDEIHVTYTGSCPALAEIGDPFTCSGHSIVTGGTGRFLEATGHLQWNATIVFEGFGDLSWPGTWEWNGTIRY